MTDEQPAEQEVDRPANTEEAAAIVENDPGLNAVSDDDDPKDDEDTAS